MRFIFNLYVVVAIYVATSVLMYMYLPQECLIVYLTIVFLWFVIFFLNKKHKNQNEKNK